jgi:hypothetical protein
LAGDNRSEHPNGFVDAESARNAAERWLKHLLEDA